MQGGDRYAPPGQEWTTNWSGIGTGSSHTENIGVNRGSPTAKFVDASGNEFGDSLTRASRYNVAKAQSTLPGNLLVNFPVKTPRPCTPPPPIQQAPKPTRRRVDRLVIEFKERCKQVAMTRAGKYGNLHLGLVKLFMENDADG